MVHIFTDAYLSRHVQVNNEDAIKFYEKFGFEIVEQNQNYYKRIEPADAYVLQKTFKEGTKTCNKPGQDPAKDMMEDNVENKENIVNSESW